ncbi:hypothetical protein Rhopal_002521-T1 [Rhodotorula paludigena]|uniref:AB hydrolase-1 domain-containing protein n=1 Tax=Rhodotorula paludigena TaxID=86838 RepID=A0AAV5GI04_9BASI|nr:hypothetical protein Rhopal_002521-T1 [Rhodotorula paludigena]
MSSYLNKQPPPPPPPRAAHAPPAPPPTASSSLAPPQPRRGHRHAQSVHYNDAPDLDFSQHRQPAAAKRDRASSRVSSSGSTPPARDSASPAPMVPAAPPEGSLPTYQPPPPPPLEPTLERRLGPRIGEFRFPADVLSFKQIDPAVPLKLLLLFVPGNPGIVHYYRAFLEALRDALPPDLRVATEMSIIGHLRHTPDAKDDRGYKPTDQPTLEEQVIDKVTYIELLAVQHKLGREGSPKLVVLGHSLGSWIALQLFKHVPQHITAMHALFPAFSHLATTPNARRLGRVLSPWSLRPLYLTSSAISYLPTSVSARLVRTLGGISDLGADATLAFVQSPEAVLASLVTAQQELAQITDLETDVLERYGDRVWIYWAAEGVDGWTTEEAIRECEEVLERAFGEEGRKRRKRCVEGMPHAFVLNEAHTASLARKCAGWIVDDLSALESKDSKTEETAAASENEQDDEKKDTA